MGVSLVDHGNPLSDWLLETLSEICERVSMPQPHLAIVDGDDGWPEWVIGERMLAWAAPPTRRHPISVTYLIAPRLGLHAGIPPIRGQDRMLTSLLIHECAHHATKEKSPWPHGQPVLSAYSILKSVVVVPFWQYLP